MLNQAQLAQDLEALFARTQGKTGGSAQREFAQQLAQIIDAFVKSGQVTGTTATQNGPQPLQQGRMT